MILELGHRCRNVRRDTALLLSILRYTCLYTYIVSIGVELREVIMKQRAECIPPVIAPGTEYVPLIAQVSVESLRTDFPQFPASELQ